MARQRRKLVLPSAKQGQSFAGAYITQAVIVICLLMEKKSLSLKPIIKIDNFANWICLGSISDRCDATESWEGS